jgi:hypothetical protein
MKREVWIDAYGEPHPVFKVVKRDEYECLHDTGLMHSTGIDCEHAEMMSDLLHVWEDDPLHDETWHAPQRVPRSSRRPRKR